MPMAFKQGDTVKQVVAPIQGSITNVAIVDQVVQYEVTWAEEDGGNHSRYFREEELAAVEDPPEDPPAQ